MVNICLFLLVLCCLVLFVVLLLGLKSNKWHNIDSLVFKWFKKYRNKKNNARFKFITLFGSAPVIITEIIICLCFFGNRYRILLLLVMIFEELLNLLLKAIIKRDRPDEESLVYEKSYSFPSGHTMASVCFYGLLLVILLNSLVYVGVKIILSIILVLAIILIPSSRIYLGVHHFSDVVAASCLSISILIIFISLFNLGIIL